MQQNDFTDVASGEPLKTYTFRLPDDLPEDDVTALREAVESFRCGPEARLNGRDLTFPLPDDTVIEEMTFDRMPTEVTGRVCGLATTSASQGDAHTAFVLSVKGHGADSRHHRFSVYPNTRIRPIGTKGSPNLALVPSNGTFDCRISLHRGEVEGTEGTKEAKNAKCSHTLPSISTPRKNVASHILPSPPRKNITLVIHGRGLGRVRIPQRWWKTKEPCGDYCTIPISISAKGQQGRRSEATVTHRSTSAHDWYRS
jgi:hypothetical protein